MNLKPEQIPDEVVEAAFNSLFPEHYERHLHPDWAPAIREALSAALPVLLGEPVIWRARRADGKFMHFDYEPKHMREYRPLYTLPTQDTPNE